MPYHNEIIWQFLLFCFVFLVCACMVRTILTGTVVHRYTVYRYQLRHLKYDHEVFCILRSLLTANTPTQERLATLPVTTSPTLFEQWCGFFYVRQEPDKWAGTYGFSSLSEIPFLQTKILKKQCTLLNFSTRRVNVVLFGTAEVTFESVDEILWYDHSKESSSTVLSRGTICHSAFSKIKFGIQSLSYIHFNHFWK